MASIPARFPSAGEDGPAGDRASGPAERCVDLEGALARLGGDLELYQEIYPMFKADAQALIGRVPELLASGQRRDAQRIFHTLKSLGANVGAIALAAAAARADLAMERNAGDEDARLIETIRGEFVTACVTLERQLQVLSAAGPA